MYTKGPWKIRSLEKHGECKVEADEILLATIVNHPKEQTANTRLIAAAPELLEACKLLDKWLINFSPNAVNKYYWKILKQAISKAEGR